MNNEPKILLIAGTHGVEPQSSYFAQELIGSDQCRDLILNQSLLVISELNPSGIKNKTRTNANGVDLNRNMPSKNWEPSEKEINGKANPYYGGPEAGSEAEVQRLIKIIEAGEFDLIISLHTNHFVEHQNAAQINFDGPKNLSQKEAFGYKFAQSLAKNCDLPLTDDIGYPTPGSLGSYCIDLNIPCITVEFEDELSGEELWEKYSAAFFECLKAKLY